MASILSLENSCILTIIAQIHCFSGDLLSLLPPKLRSRILLHISAVDLYRLGHCRTLWEGVPYTSEDVWKRRFDTTLSKYSNVQLFQEVKDLSWLDRYLVSCLINIPKPSSDQSSHPSTFFGSSFFVTSNIFLYEADVLKVKCGLTFHCLNSLETKQRGRVSTHFTSSYYHEKKLQVYPFNSTVGSGMMSSYERLKCILTLFPNWKPLLIPLEYDNDDIMDSSHHIDDKHLCESFISNAQSVFLLSRYLRLHPYAEVPEEYIPRDQSVPGEVMVNPFCYFMLDLIMKRSNDAIMPYRPFPSCWQVYFSQIPVKKKTVYMVGLPDDEVDTTVSYTPIYSVSSIVNWFHQHCPNISDVTVVMHDSNQVDCWDCSVFKADTLHSVQLKVIRPTFIKVMSIKSHLPFSNLGSIALNGLVVSGEEFKDILLLVLNSPCKQSLKFSNFSIKELSAQRVREEITSPESRVMDVDCQYKTSLLFHRVRGIHHVYHVLATFPEVWLDDLSLYIADKGTVPFPKSTVFNCKSIHAERFTADEDNLDLIAPVFGRAEKVFLSVGESGLTTAPVAFPRLSRCIQMCETNLVYLDCKYMLPFIGLQASHVIGFLKTVMSLPDSIIEGLVFNPSRLVDTYASVVSYQGGGMFLAAGPQSVRDQASSKENEERLKCWRMLYEIWKRRGCQVKFRKLTGIHQDVLEKLEDELAELCSTFEL